MANKDLLVGSIVKLSPDHNWAKTPSNPLNTVGEVISNKQGHGTVIVHWSNRTTNSYNQIDSDLILIESP